MPNSSSPNRGVDGCGQPVSECRPHGPSAPNHRLIPVVHMYPLGLKQSPEGKARPRPTAEVGSRKPSLMIILYHFVR